jgi:signal transduction histidine kinase
VAALQSVSIPESIEWVLRCIDRNTNPRVLITAHDSPPYIHPFIITDKQWLLENLLCMMSNAAKFVSAGSIVMKVAFMSPAAPDATSTTSASPDSTQLGLGFLRFEVEDTGVGIPKDKIDKLFEPFQGAELQSRYGVSMIYIIIYYIIWCV